MPRAKRKAAKGLGGGQDTDMDGKPHVPSRLGRKPSWPLRGLLGKGNISTRT